MSTIKYKTPRFAFRDDKRIVRVEIIKETPHFVTYMDKTPSGHPCERREKKDGYDRWHDTYAIARQYLIDQAFNALQVAQAQECAALHALQEAESIPEQEPGQPASLSASSSAVGT